MKDERKTKKQLIEELNEVRQRVEQLRETSTEPAIRTLMNASSDTAMLIEPNGNILTVNALSAERIGRSIDELEGKNIFDLIPPETAKYRKKLIRKVVRSGNPEHFVSDKYEDKVLAASIFPIINAKGRVTHLAVFEHDITERVRAEEKLKDSEERYRNLFEASPQGIITADLEGEITSCNSVFLELSGFSEEEIVGKHFTKLPTLPAENLPDYEDMYDDLMRGKVPENFEFKWLHKDGTTRLAGARIGLLKENGHLIGVQVIVQDITERVHAEEALINRDKRLQSFFDNAAIGIAIADSKGRYQQVNNHYLEMFGYDSEEELFQKTVREITHPDDREATRKAQMGLAEGEINFYRDEKRFLRKDGSFFWGDVSVSPIKELNGEIYAFTAIIFDTTERKQADEALEASEIRFHTYTESTPAAMLILQDYKCIFANPAAKELTGYSDEELLSKKIEELVHPDHTQYVIKAIKALEKGEILPVQFELKIVTKKGDMKWIDARSELIEYDGMHVALISALDITERKKAEEELRESEEKYRLVVENSIEGIAVVQDGLISFTNPGVEKLLVYSKEELIHKPFIEFVHPEDREIITERYQKRLKGKEIPQSYQVRLIDKVGSVKWVEVKVVMIEWEGNTATLAFVNDITERNKAEEELRESHNYLNNILNGMFAGMLVLDLNYEIVDVNSSFLEEHNISREEIIGHKCYEITHQSNQPCDSSQCVCPMRSIVENTLPTQVEHRHVSPEGEERFVEINFFPLFEADGEVGRVVEIIHDVTERVQAEEQVRIEAGRAKAMARIATSLNTHLDVEAVGKAICEEAASALGVPLVSVCLYDSERDELVPAGQFGTPSTNLIDVQSIPCEFYCEPIQQSDPVVVFPNIQDTSEFPKLDLFTNLDIRTLVSAKIQRDEQFIGRMNILTIGEERTFTKDEFILLQGLANQAAIALENARLFQSEQDSHHKSEALRRAALVLTSTMAMDQVLEGILAELQKVVPFDNASVQLLEEDQLRVVTGRGFSNLADLIGTSFPARGRFRYSRVLETRKPFSKNIEVPRFDQQNSPEEEQRSWLGVPLLIGDRIIGIITLNKLNSGFYTENHGEIAMAFAAAAANAIENAQLFRDLQDKMQILRETRNLLVQNEKLAAIGELVSGIAHELNNPISAILLLAQDSLQEESKQEIKSNLDKIVSESRRTAKIVRDLLAFSKQRSPDVDLIQTNDVIVYTLDLLAYEIRKNNIKVTTELSKEIPLVLVDPLQIQQVVINIVNNACQAMAADPENAYLRITTETGPSIFLPESGTPQVVRVMFQDSGPGIHSYVLPRVFDPFFTTKPLGKGTGLGLSICHGIVNEHGGHIWVESELGQGATFFVELPVASLDEQRPTITEEQPPQLLSPSKYRILIIDDEESLLEILSRVLRRRGYQVVAVNNGEEGLDHAIKTNPDLILCDLLMPGMSGQDIYYYLKSHASELLNRVLFTTGDTLSPETRQFLEETDVKFLRKPFELDHLIDVVEEAIMGTG